MENLNNLLNVAHFNNVFLRKSQTFIYNYISNHKAFYPYCLSWEFINGDVFKLSNDKCVSLQLKRYSFKWFAFGLIKKILDRDLYFEKIIRRNKIKVIHAHFGYNGIYALKIKRNTNIPLITTFYGADVSDREYLEEVGNDYQNLFENGDLFLVEGLSMKEKLIKLGCSEKKISIQRIAIPIKNIDLELKKKDSIKKREKTIFLFAGRFVEKKGLISALKAFKLIEKKKELFEFHIIGDGPLKDTIEKFIDENKMNDYVKLLGFLDYGEYLKQLSNADVFIHPSVTAGNGDSEGGAPTTILEAQALKKPIISTYHADIPNIVLENKSALLSKERDINSLVENILKMMNNQDIRKEFGLEGRLFVEKYHDVEKEIIELENKYGLVIKKSENPIKI